jgi:hypothetical protein
VKSELPRLATIGRHIGRICATTRTPISCSDLASETLEHWALKGVHEVTGVEPTTVYLHYNVDEGYLKNPSAIELANQVKSSCRFIEVPYPSVDADRLQSLSDDIARERVGAQDARLGSLLQCDAVVLVGGNKSAEQLVLLLNYIERLRFRAANPILFIPIPWIDGVGRAAHAAFRGVLDDADFVGSVVPSR